jgi:membrane protein DedA with SNARE-associated domain
MGNRGLGEVSSYVLDFLRKVVSEKEVTLFSDFFSRHNRYTIVSAVFLQTIRTVNIR